MIFTQHDEQTIIAQCTPIGSGALAMLRLSGAQAIVIATNISKLSRGKKIDFVPTHTIQFGWVMDENENNIDQVLFLVMHGPKTFTGQDTVEITCHNNQFIVEAIIHQAISCGARLAQPGEFTKRAFLNKKIDLTQAEAINELINAHTQEAIKKSLEQLEGSFSNWLSTIQNQLLKALTLCEASFEFLEDEDISFDNEIKSIIQEILIKIEKSHTQYNQQQHIKEGVRIALIGQVNAGKSSLFNTLISQDRAIVTEIAGTTRDVIECGIYRDGTFITFADTAGLRHTHDRIEQEGIKRSFQEAQKADIILLIIDGSEPVKQNELIIYQKLINDYAHKIIALATKSDLKKYEHVINDVPFLPVSVMSGQNIENLQKIIAQKIQDLLKNYTMPFLINNRQHQLLQGLQHALQDIKSKMGNELEYELITIHLKDALEKLTELTGKTINELSMDAIFKNFCVGK